MSTIMPPLSIEIPMPEGAGIPGQVWIVGKTVDAESGAWEFQGVFTSHDKAVVACRSEFYFTGPAILDESLPDETMPDWPGCYRPTVEARPV